MAIDAELLESVKNGTADLDSLPSHVLDELLALEGGSQPPAEDPKPEDNLPPAEDPKPKKKPKTIDEFKEDRFRLNSELNTERQRREALERKLRELEQKPAEDLDIWDTDWQKKQAQEVAEAKRVAQEAAAELAAIKAERAMEAVYRESQAVADEFGIKVNVREVNEQFKQAVAERGRLLTQDEFAELVGEDEAEGFFDLMAADQHKRTNNFGKLRTALRDLELDEKYKGRGQAPKPNYDEAAARKAEAEANRQAIAKGKDAAPTMPSSYSGKDNTMSREWAMNWLEKKSGREATWTDEDKSTFQKIQEKYL